MKDYQSTGSGMRFRITAAHLVSNLGTDLYPNNGARVWELIRNGASASMVDEDHWNPALPHLEVHLLDHHPLCREGKTLIFLDHGMGFTQRGLQRFCNLGKSIEERATQKSYHYGASQKGIGRLAALALNRQIVDDHDWETGVYIFTRNQSRGNITLFSMIPNEIERRQEIPMDIIAPDSSLLGKTLREITGSFTAIVIPYSVYENAKQIVNDITYRLPRKKDLELDIKVNGTKVIAPALASELTLTDKSGKIEVYIKKASDAEMQDQDHGGIWLCDADTGFRVTPLAKIASVPDPLWSQRLCGDVFVPAVLENQDTSRAGLKTPYLRGPAWRKVLAFFYNQVVPKAKDLIGDDDFGNDEVGRTLREVVNQIHMAFGKPPAESNVPPGIKLRPINPTIERDPIERGKRRNKNGNEGGNGSHNSSIPIRIEDETYYLSSLPMDKELLAEVNFARNNVICINSQYRNFPSSRIAKNQHMLEEIFGAIGAHRHSTNPRESRRFKNRCLHKLQKPR